MADARAKGDFGAIVGLEKALAFKISGHVLHSIFWKNLSPDGGDKPEGVLANALDEHFGSFDVFKGDRLVKSGGDDGGVVAGRLGASA